METRKVELPPKHRNEVFTVERIENGYVTRADTLRVQRTLYHSNTGGVISEFNKAFGTQRLSKELTTRALGLAQERLKERKDRALQEQAGED